MNQPIRLAIVVPCYNEEEVLPETNRRLHEVLLNLQNLGKITADSFIVYVNDGSKDNTWNLISTYHQTSPQVSGIKLSRNRGHQNALMAGLMHAKDYADAVISVDADLQDDLNVMTEMVDHFLLGKEIVFGVRSSRKADSFFKRFTAESFYKVMNSLGAKTIYNHADYRLMSKRVLFELEGYREVNLFLRGVVMELGFPTAFVTYERKERFAGVSKYPFKKMLSFAIDGITSFSIKPIRMIAVLGIVIVFLSILAAIYTLVSYFILGAAEGWTSLMVSIWFFGGVQLFAIGLIGEYVGKSYIETKHRPRYLVETKLHHESNESL